MYVNKVGHITEDATSAARVLQHLVLMSFTGSACSRLYILTISVYKTIHHR